MTEIRNTYKSLVRKPERKGASWRSGKSWQDNNRTDLKKIAYSDVECIHLARHSDGEWKVPVSMQPKLLVPAQPANFLTECLQLMEKVNKGN